MGMRFTKDYVRQAVTRLNEQLGDIITELDIHSPGDGTTRYRFSTYGGSHINALGAKDAFAIVQAIRAGAVAQREISTASVNQESGRVR